MFNDPPILFDHVREETMGENHILFDVYPGVSVRHKHVDL